MASIHGPIAIELMPRAAAYPGPLAARLYAGARDAVLRLVRSLAWRILDLETTSSRSRPEAVHGPKGAPR
ncbi:MAG: hypothetical protein JWN86_145 [Planctomycetota bacterium]|nr:hypothetical protein [Planctomycetota bacterium]